MKQCKSLIGAENLSEFSQVGALNHMKSFFPEYSEQECLIELYIKYCLQMRLFLMRDLKKIPLIKKLRKILLILKILNTRRKEFHKSKPMIITRTEFSKNSQAK